jgi:hypothetical protein
VGGASGNADLSPASRAVPMLRHSAGTDRVPDPKARVTRRLRQQIGVDCQPMPTSHWAGAPRGEVGQGAQRGEGVSRRAGSAAREAPAAPQWLGQPNAPLQPRRLMIAPAAVGCKRMLASITRRLEQASLFWPHTLRTRH